MCVGIIEFFLLYFFNGHFASQLYFEFLAKNLLVLF